MIWRKKPSPRPPTVTETINDAQWAMLTNLEQRLLYAIERRQLGRTDDFGFQHDLTNWRKEVRFSFGLGIPREERR